MATRRAKWHPPPPPTPQILHLPRRSRRRPTASRNVTVRPTKSPPTVDQEPVLCGRLDTLFDQESSFIASDRRRGRVNVEVIESSTGGGESEEEKWRFQAEILRAECNFLRMERVAALKKEAALRSAVDSLVTDRRKIDGRESAREVVKELEGKLEGLSIRTKRCGGMEVEVGKGNFDKKALLLRRRLQEMNVREMMPKKERGRTSEVDGDGDVCATEIREIAADSNSLQVKNQIHGSDNKNSKLPEVEILRRKMECISKGMLDKMEEYGTILSTTSCSLSAHSTTNTRSRRTVVKAAEKAPSSDQTHQREEECWGKCRVVVGRIVEEVRAETEQWGEMQGMLEQVREEMDDLRCSRDFWERCALHSDEKLRSTNAQVMEWRQRALSSEQRASELQRQLMEVQSEVEEIKRELQERRVPPPPATSTCETQRRRMERQKENREKRVISCRLENNNYSPPPPPQSRRQPLRDICNLTTATGKNPRRIRILGESIS